jgi:hypothetical protein
MEFTLAMRIVAAMFALALVPGPIHSQSVLDEIEAAIGSRVDELGRAEALLADPDPARRIAAMEALLESGDPAFVTMAKEVGLFSDDPRLRSAAVRAILDAGGAFRAEFSIPPGDDVTDIYSWLKIFNGSWSEDLTRGYFGFVVGPYDEDAQCWTFAEARSRDSCAFRMSGEDVMTGNWSFNTSGSAIMRLNDAGALTGWFLVNGRGTPVEISIPLIN